MTSRLVLGAALLAVRPVYVVIELVVASAVTGGYSLLQDTVSDLGAVGCSSQLCSPRHALMNGAFVLVGLALIVGALLLRVRVGSAVTALLVVAGLSSAATGLAPIDEDGTLHALAAAPLFVCQPLALLLLGRRTAPSGIRVALLLTGTLTAAAAVAFVALDTWSGLYERAALWPVLFAIALFALGSQADGSGLRNSGAGAPPSSPEDGRARPRGRRRAPR